MADGGRRYAIVSPVRNEERYVRQTLESVVAQRETPVAWVIVDDGSTDDTAAIVREYASRSDFIRLVSNACEDNPKPADRLLWAAEVVAFNTGLREIDLGGVDYIVKLDGDLAFGPEYFSSLMDEFEADPSLGMAGGYCYQVAGGKRRMEWNPESHVRGPTKMYRTECFEQIGGIPCVYAWDALDEIKAQMAGWRTRSFALPVDHLKPTGTVGGLMRARVRQGIGAYLLGYHPAFVLARSARLAMAPPRVLGGLAFVAGFVQAVAERPARIADVATIAYLRDQQMARLRNIWNGVEMRSLLGKGRSRT